MIGRRQFLGLCLIVLLSSTAVAARQASPGNSGSGLAMNRLITFNGTLRDTSGAPLIGSAGITFTLYASQDGEDPLWRESQVVQTDEQGRYTVLLGSTENQGLPLEVFGTGGAQWLGIQAESQEEQPRVLLLAVPYALKAADADTVGGKPLSSFVLYEDLAKARDTIGPTAIVTTLVPGETRSSKSTTAGSSAFGRSIQARDTSIIPLLSNEIGTNTYFGESAGAGLGGGGTWNSFFGESAGTAVSTGVSNQFFGYHAGFLTNSGNYNAAVGTRAGNFNTSGSRNVFLGQETGWSNTTESNNSFLGAFSNGIAGITNATAIGYQAKVARSNSLVLGSINGENGATADTTVAIGRTAPNPAFQTRLEVQGLFTDPLGSRGTASYGYYNPLSTQLDGYVFGLESGASYTGAANLTRNHKNSQIYAFAALQGYYGGTVATGSGGAGSVATVSGVVAQNLVRNGITVTDAIGLQVQAASADVGSATVSNVTGVYVKNPYNVTPVNVYGLYTEALTAGTNNYGVYISGNSKSYFGGNVGIGTTTPLDPLHVVGNVRIQGGNIVPADYVFEPDYRLMPLEKLAEFISREKHLPNVPPAAEVNEKGLNLGEFQMRLLEKIEELTLYAVRQANDHKTALQHKDAEISSLAARVSVLEQMIGRLNGENAALQK